MAQIFSAEVYEGFYQQDVMGMVRLVNEIMITVDFTFIALILSLLSLSTLLSLSILKRIKEIDIRKILEATLPNTALLISKSYFRLLIFASAIGIIAAYFVLELLLDIIYDYRMPVTYLTFLFPVLSIFL